MCIRDRSHGIPHFKSDLSRRHPLRDPHLQRSHFTRLFQSLVTDPLTLPNFLSRRNKRLGKIDPYHLIRTPRHLQSRAPHRATHIERPLHPPFRKMPHSSHRKIQRFCRTSGPRQDFLRASKVKKEILSDISPRLINLAHCQHSTPSSFIVENKPTSRSASLIIHRIEASPSSSPKYQQVRPKDLKEMKTGIPSPSVPSWDSE